MSDQKYFNENDLRVLFPEVEEKKEPKSPEIEFTPVKSDKKQPIWKVYAKFAGLFVGIFIFTFVLVNFTSLSKELRYFFDVQLRGQEYNQAVAVPTPANSFNPESEATLTIPKIGASAPISWNVSESQVTEKLLEGVVHSQGMALPGQKGNIFISGHSSYYIWSSSPYKSVFALLEKLDVGDKIYIQYKGADFTYTVSETKVVSPKDLSVMEQTPDYRLTLMTCVPVGTNLNRLIVTAIQSN